MTRSRTPVAHRVTTVAGATALALAGMATVAHADHDVTTDRISGPDRFATANAIAERDHDTTTDAVLARSDDFADALAAAPLARELGAPILLTESDELTQATEDELAQLEVATVTIVGGTTAVSQDVEDRLDDLGYTVERLAGDDRYATAAAVGRFVQEANGNGTNFVSGRRAIFLATGQGFADAMTAGGLAASRPDPIPVLLTEPDEASQPTVDLVEDLDVDLVLIAGGEDAVSARVEATFDDDDTNVVRIAGQTRTATAAELADFGIEFMDVDPATLVLARGDGFADALAAGPHAGGMASPIVLTRTPDVLSAPTTEWLVEQCDAISTIEVVGGEAAVSESTAQEAETAAETCHASDGDGTERQTYIVSPQEPAELEPGQSQQFQVGARYDGQDVTEDLDVVLFPQDAIEQQDGEWVFSDTNDDQRADGIESTDTGNAMLTMVNGEAITPARGVRDADTADGDVSVTVSSEAQDGAYVVFFHDTQNNSALDVNADGDPVEPWGLGKVTWSS